MQTSHGFIYKDLVTVTLALFNLLSHSLVLPTLSYFVVLFCRLRALSTKYNSHPQAASRPFDCGRDGFVYVIPLLNYVPYFQFFHSGACPYPLF
jgi:hypothetical protein